MLNTENYLRSLRALFDAQPQPRIQPRWLWLSPEQREQRLRELLQPQANRHR
ncbi:MULTISPECIES: hypothetical protein [Tenebrionibacter/Tenebrionicola group]|jgi:hypothetical protein|uniref:Uncharacterized protein n=2 Tax=Tenebrionibacter/Tenebrionicola group TaxID=2969848 RepID=A0A8K0V0N6_9ENTR|nr:MULTISPECIES: hypothetical protein [Tenebrionibacter/Tenebrionicola group]MBK4714682.1 hypothetical protein [Tenebrionibacter intestinalis]MBV5095152.1 hypothetical protein [Tenebrionicola larvae]